MLKTTRYLTDIMMYCFSIFLFAIISYEAYAVHSCESDGGIMMRHLSALSAASLIPLVYIIVLICFTHSVYEDFGLKDAAIESFFYFLVAAISIGANDCSSPMMEVDQAHFA